MMERYFEEWSENTPISWWNDGRRQLNTVVRMVNEWSLAGRPPEGSSLILRHIDMGLQTFAAQDGGSGWAAELEKMKAYVEGG